MGYNTTIMVLNDRWDEIQKRPADWVDDLSPFVRELKGTGNGNHHHRLPLGHTTVIQPYHASERVVLLGGGNTLIRASTYDPIVERCIAMGNTAWIENYITHAESNLEILKNAIDVANKRR
jgi:hypothetical protein